MSVNVEKITVGKLRTNAYIVYNEHNEGFIVDPSFDIYNIIETIKEKSILIQGILITHGHFDHIYMVNEIKNELELIQNNKIDIYMNENGMEVLKDKNQNLIEEYMGEDKTIKVDRFLTDGEKIKIANISIESIFVGGHTIDSCTYYIEKEKILFSGDTLFYSSIGRTDLYKSDENQEIENLIKKILILEECTTVYPGHGRTTTIKDEKKNNKYLKNN